MKPPKNLYKNPLQKTLIITIILIALIIILLPKSPQQPPSNSTIQTPEPPINQTQNSLKEPYIITKVIDGDTVHINGESVRLICIDTPERGEDGYLEATEFLESLILNQEVTLEEDITKRDKYNRLLYYIFTKDGRFVNEIMVKEGYAEAYPYYPDTRLCPQIQEAEKQAKLTGKNIWEPEEEVEQEKQIINNECSSNIYNCGDFKTHKEAQAVFETCGGVSNDIHQLDGDKDGQACETLR